MDRILACIDNSDYAAGVCDLAAWAAGRLNTSIELLHVIQRKDAVAARHDLSGAIGLGVKSELLEELTRIDEAEGRLAIERGRLLLKSGEERLRAAGVDQVSTLARHGGIVETIVERETDADLVVIGKRGASGTFAAKHLGSKVERVVRESIRPVLVATKDHRPIDTLVVAFDGSPASSRGLSLVAMSPLFDGLTIQIVMVGAQDANHQRQLQAAEDRFKARAGTTSHLLQGRAEKVIGEHIRASPNAMLVMGAYGHSPLRELIVGSTTTALIRTAEAPVLLVR